MSVWAGVPEPLVGPLAARLGALKLSPAAGAKLLGEPDLRRGFLECRGILIVVDLPGTPPLRWCLIPPVVEIVQSNLLGAATMIEGAKN